jgi:hypothetical protein
VNLLIVEVECDEATDRAGVDRTRRSKRSRSKSDLQAEAFRRGRR